MCSRVGVSFPGTRPCYRGLLGTRGTGPGGEPLGCGSARGSSAPIRGRPVASGDAVPAVRLGRSPRRDEDRAGGLSTVGVLAGVDRGGAQAAPAGRIRELQAVAQHDLLQLGRSGILRHQCLSVLGPWCIHPTMSVLRAKFPDYRSDVDGAAVTTTVSNYRFKVPTVKSFDRAEAYVYKTYVAMLYEFVAAATPLGLLRSLEEPEVGNPFSIRYRGRSTSQDLCNSVHEDHAAGGGDLPVDGPSDVAELGAGYGRVGTSPPGAAAGIEPHLRRQRGGVLRRSAALSCSSEERVFGFRPFARFEDVREEFEGARIRFLAAPPAGARAREDLPGSICSLTSVRRSRTTWRRSTASVAAASAPSSGGSPRRRSPATSSARTSTRSPPRGIGCTGDGIRCSGCSSKRSTTSARPR